MRSGIVWIALFWSCTLVACGNQEDKMERGLVVDREVADPTSAREMDMTEAERQKQNEAQDEADEEKAFERSME